MAHYKLYCIGASGNAYKVALYLNCAGLDWEPVGVDFAGGQMRDEAWRAATNVMGEVPVLEVDGRHMSQSDAILAWLAETTGKFAPDHEQGAVIGAQPGFDGSDRVEVEIVGRLVKDQERRRRGTED